MNLHPEWLFFLVYRYVKGRAQAHLDSLVCGSSDRTARAAPLPGHSGSKTARAACDVTAAHRYDRDRAAPRTGAAARGGTNTKEHKGIKGKRATFKSDFNTTRTATATSCVKLGLLLSPTSREIQWIARNKPGQGWSLEVRKLYSDILSNWNKIQQDLTKRRWSKPPSGTVEGICGNICIASKRAKETQSKHPRFTAKLHNKSCTFPTFVFLSTTDEEEKWVMSDQACLPWSWNPTVSFQMRRVIPSVEEGCKRCLWRGTRVNVCRFDCITGCEADWKYTTKIQRNMCTNIIRTRFCNINP